VIAQREQIAVLGGVVAGREGVGVAAVIEDGGGAARQLDPGLGRGLLAATTGQHHQRQYRGGFHATPWVGPGCCRC
jgi:hypothetical protein